MTIIPIQINNYNTDKQLQLALREKSFRYQEICQTNKACQVNFDEINIETYYRSGIIYTNTNTNSASKIKIDRLSVIHMTY